MTVPTSTVVDKNLALPDLYKPLHSVTFQTLQIAKKTEAYKRIRHTLMSFWLVSTYDLD